MSTHTKLVATTLLSPHDVASVLGVSESTVKRWVDIGRLVADRTGGGHRRVSWEQVLRFAEEHRQPLLRGSLATTSLPVQAAAFRAALAANDPIAAEVAVARAWCSNATPVDLLESLVVTTWTADRGQGPLSAAARQQLEPLAQRLRRAMDLIGHWTPPTTDAAIAIVGWTGDPGDAVIGSAFAGLLAQHGFRVTDRGADLSALAQDTSANLTAVFLVDPWGSLGQPQLRAAQVVESCRAHQVPCVRTSRARGGLDWADALLWGQSRLTARRPVLMRAG